MPLFHDLEIGEEITINENIVISITEKTGQKVRIRLDADRSVPINIGGKRRKESDGKGGGGSLARPPAAKKMATD